MAMRPVAVVPSLIVELPLLSVIASFGDMGEQLLAEVLPSLIVSYREDIPEQETSPLIL